MGRATLALMAVALGAGCGERKDAAKAPAQPPEVQVVKANRERERLADLRYRNGVTIYVEVLLAQQQTFESELQYSQANRNVYEAVVNLYTALGGGWEPAPASPTATVQ